jgi:hypothetical protein
VRAGAQRGLAHQRDEAVAEQAGRCVAGLREQADEVREQRARVKGCGAFVQHGGEQRTGPWCRTVHQRFEARHQRARRGRCLLQLVGG